MLAIHRRRFQMFAVGLAAVVLAGCNVSSATLGDLYTAKDKEAKTKATTFAPGDTIWIFAPARFLPGKVSMKLTTYAEKIDGMAPHTAIPGLSAQVELTGDGEANFNLSPPAAGWPNGQLKLEVSMVSVDDNIERGKKAIIVTTAGNTGAAPAEPPATNDGSPGADAEQGDAAANNEPQR